MRMHRAGRLLVALIFATLGGSEASGRAPSRTGQQEPDISGVWSFATLTPLERPARFAGKRFLTPEEAAAWEQEMLRAGDQPLGGAPVIDALWLERGHLATLDGQYVTSLVSDPPDGRVPALTPGAQARLTRRAATLSRSEGPEDRTLSERCLRSGSGPPMFPSPDANIVQIVQTREHAVLVTEKFHEARIVPLDSRPSLSATLRSWIGDSRGRWEGNTLVVDTSHFTEKIGLTGRFDENLHLVERLTRTGPDSLRYDVRIDDPSAFTAPWSVTIPMTRTSERLYEFACHEGNYSLPNILSAARALERAGR